jgi:hypothetical protein
MNWDENAEVIKFINYHVSLNSFIPILLFLACFFNHYTCAHNYVYSNFLMSLLMNVLVLNVIETLIIVFQFSCILKFIDLYLQGGEVILKLNDLRFHRSCYLFLISTMLLPFLTIRST